MNDLEYVGVIMFSQIVTAIPATLILSYVMPAPILNCARLVATALGILDAFYVYCWWEIYKKRREENGTEISSSGNEDV